jgi:RNA polymerase-binding transcription factor DksA
VVKLINNSLLCINIGGKQGMIPILIEEFAKRTAQHNKDVDEKALVKALKETLRAKKNGAKCCQCGQPIWAAGSAVTGVNMCFTCTTLESDDSEDYEVFE